MKQILIVFLSLFITCVSYAQLSVDTLVIAGNKFSIKKIPTYIYPWAKLPLPCEYEKLDNSVSLQYKTDADTTYGVTHEYEFGGDLLIAVMGKSNDTSDIKYIHLNNFLDTFVVSKNNLGTLKPYIKSKNDTIRFFCAKVSGLKDGCLTIYDHELRPYGDIFSFWADSWGKNVTKEDLTKTTFIVEDIYYRKGLTTYYFNRQFIVIVK